MAWQDEQHFESNWWGKCLVTFWEETKQLEYAEKMGIKAEVVAGQYPFYDFQAKTIIDIGGGPVSMLLKAKEPITGVVVDPCDYPEWTLERYKDAGIEFSQRKGEDILPEQYNDGKPFDLSLIYNVLQHVDNPQLVIENARKVSKLIRIFEWVNTPKSPGHPHTLTKENLDRWLHGEGRVEEIHKNGCHGFCYFGVFPTGL